MFRRWLRPPRLIILGALILLKLSSAQRPPGIGVHDGRLADCPASPNCVSGDATGDHYFAPLPIKGEPSDAWRVVRSVLAEQPRTYLVEEKERYLYAECVTLVLRFVDDLEIALRSDPNRLVLRSASRAGSYDWGVNRRRVEAIAEELRRRGVVE